MKQSKGITLISLVITIIILLILAGISIQAMTSTGLFEAAGRAKKEAKRAQVIEWLNLKMIEQQSENTKGTAKDIIKATQESVKNNISELETIGKDIVVENTKTEEDGEKADIYFYVQVDKDVYKVDIKGAQFLGEAGKFPPIIKIESITSTTNSITVKVSTKRNEGGELKFYIKAENEEKYKDIEKIKTEKNADNLEFTYNGLDQNKKYNVKIVAVKNKLQTEVLVDKTLEGVTNLTTANVTFTYDPSSWTNGNVKVTAALKDMTSSYTLKITDSNPVGASKTTALGWKNASDGITVDTNKTIYTVLIDNEGQIGGAATGNVEKIDTQKPVINMFVETNSITFNANDNAKTGEKASGIAGYIVQESASEPNANGTNWTNYNGIDKTVGGLVQGKAYYLFVKDNAGNITSLSTNELTITPNKTELTADNITTTISYGSKLTQNRKAGYGTTINEARTAASSNTATSVTATENGYVYAEATDVAGNKISVGIPITNIRYVVTCEDYFVTSSYERKVKLGSSSKLCAKGDTVSGSDWGVTKGRGIYYTDYCYENCSSSVVNERNIVVYRYFSAYVNINILNSYGQETLDLATFGLTIQDVGSWSGINNEPDVGTFYGSGIWISINQDVFYIFGWNGCYYSAPNNCWWTICTGPTTIELAKATVIENIDINSNGLALTQYQTTGVVYQADKGLDLSPTNTYNTFYMIVAYYSENNLINAFNVDLWPDDLPEIHPVTQGNSWRWTPWSFRTDNLPASIKNCVWRVFDDIQDQEKDTIRVCFNFNRVGDFTGRTWQNLYI